MEDIEAAPGDVTGCGFCIDAGMKFLYDEDLLQVIWFPEPVPVRRIIDESTIESDAATERVAPGLRRARHRDRQRGLRLRRSRLADRRCGRDLQRPAVHRALSLEGTPPLLNPGARPPAAHASRASRCRYWLGGMPSVRRNIAA